MILDYVQARLNTDSRFHYIGRGANDGHWRTTPKGQDPWETSVDLKKIYGYKNFAAVMITLFNEENYGVWMKIEFWLPSYCEWSTHFEGYIEKEEDYDNLFRMLGL